MTKREKQLRDLLRTVAIWETRRAAAIRTLVRSETQIPALRKRVVRLQNLLNKPAAPVGKVVDPSPAPPVHVPEDRGKHDDPVVPKDDAGTKAPTPSSGDPKEEGIPTWLLRSPLPAGVAIAAHAVANAHNAPPTEEQRKLVTKTKREVKKQHLEAKLTGKDRKWPLTGKAARAALK